MGSNRTQKPIRYALVTILLPLAVRGEWRVTQPVSWDLHDLVFVENTGWAIGDNGILKTEDAGNSWTVDDAVGGSAIWLWDSSRGLAAGSSGLWRMQGDTWIQISTPLPLEEIPRRFVFHDELRGWLLLGRSLWRTFDGGESWEEILRTPEDDPPHTRTEMNHSCCWDYQLRDMYFSDEQNGYIVGGYRFHEGRANRVDGNLLNITSDGGESWTSGYESKVEYLTFSEHMTSSWERIFGGVFGIPGRFAWIVGSGEIVLARQYGQHVWEQILDPSDVGNFEIWDQFGYYHTDMFGQNWELNTGVFLNEYTGWLAGERILHTMDGGGSWTVEDENSYWLTRMIQAGNRLIAVGHEGEVAIREISGFPTAVRATSWGEVKLGRRIED